MENKSKKIKIKVKKSFKKKPVGFHRPTKKIKPKKGKGSYSRGKQKKEVKNEMKKN